jgi:hypothetical protein
VPDEQKEIHDGLRSPCECEPPLDAYGSGSQGPGLLGESRHLWGISVPSRQRATLA